MSVWQENSTSLPVEANSVDVHFRIVCRELPIDHAHALSNALLEKVPWINDVPNVGIHSIYVAGSQNGWERPNASTGGRLVLSKRTRLRIRILAPYAERLIADLRAQRLTIQGEPLDILSGAIKTFDTNATLFCRSCSFFDVNEPERDESNTIDQVKASCEQMGFTPNKILCGKSQSIKTVDGSISARSVMIADVPMRYSLTLQDVGLGRWRVLGCGILIPHKDTAAIN